MKNWVELMDQRITDLTCLYDRLDKMYYLIHGKTPIVSWHKNEIGKVNQARKARVSTNKGQMELIDRMNFYKEMKKINWN